MPVPHAPSGRAGSRLADLLAGLRRSLGDAVEVLDDSTPIDDKIRAV